MTEKVLVVLLGVLERVVHRVDPEHDVQYPMGKNTKIRTAHTIAATIIIAPFETCPL